jgi:hypothetical protein
MMPLFGGSIWNKRCERRRCWATQRQASDFEAVHVPPSGSNQTGIALSTLFCAFLCGYTCLGIRGRLCDVLVRGAVILRLIKRKRYRRLKLRMRAFGGRTDVQSIEITFTTSVSYPGFAAEKAGQGRLGCRSFGNANRVSLSLQSEEGCWVTSCCVCGAEKWGRRRRRALNFSTPSSFSDSEFPIPSHFTTTLQPQRYPTRSRVRTPPKDISILVSRP